MALAAAALCVVSSLLFLPGEDLASGANSDTTVPSTPNNGYELRVYAFGQILRETDGISTRFSFDVSELPFDLASLTFGGFRSDNDFDLSFYGGSGLLVNASGGNGTIALAESTGKEVTEVWYRGQGLLVFTGETRYTTCPESVSVSGTDVMVHDWRSGNWSPEDGVVFLHPSSVTLSYAEFYVMVLEPAYTVSVPEYELLPAFGVCLLIIVAAKRTRFFASS